MSTFNNADWVKNTIVLLMASVPYDYISANDLVTNYLSTTGGGWVPDDMGEPTGYGHPANNQTPDQAATTLVTQSFTNTDTLTATFNINVTLKAVGSFPPSTTNTDVFTALQSNIEDRIGNMFNGSVKLNSFSYGSSTLTQRAHGVMSASDMVAINSEITTSTNLMDPAAIATAYVRNVYGLDSTWMCNKLYNRSDYPIVSFVRKYTSTAYTTLDVSFVSGPSTTTYQGYVVYVDPGTFKVSSCLINPLAITTT